MTPEISLTLVGKVGVWAQRIRADGRGSVWIAWLRHSSCGVIGIYVLPKHVARAEVLPQRVWVQAQGLLRPLRVLAREDDPRSENAMRLAPVLLHTTAVTLCPPATLPPAREPQPIQLRPGHWIGAGYLAPARNIADVFCFLPSHPCTNATPAWNKLAGVLVRAGQHCYLRYVLTHSAY
jgi:hypothetical protein